MHKAPSIYHSEDRPDCFKQMIFDCARNIHLREHATRLLLFYANQANGFSPALTLISRETGLSMNKIQELRQQLINYGLINYSNERRFIHIGWSRIRAFALLESPLRLTRNKCVFYSFTEIPKILSHQVTIKTIGKKYRIKNPRILEPDEEDFYSSLEEMTEAKYVGLVAAMKEYEFPNYNLTPIDVSAREWVSCIEDE